MSADTLGLVRKVVKELAERPTEAAEKYLTGLCQQSGFLQRHLRDADRTADHKLGIDYIQRRAALIDQVTLDQVQAAAKSCLRPCPPLWSLARRWVQRTSPGPISLSFSLVRPLRGLRRLYG
ncbi:hypothetical protein GCM10010869_28700 [Mesorhizobium tianshanense]|uniref:hypothetical protein n=1 Tax=Mesorhizobium tianshanense TaxID=39844 RepID=UPI001ABFD46E|nr:hypothetical protein [Mesorhizobium tianshanense]GLS37277.1 hypothetical protein GCM10010869_28700 [Mesorhizobium tianshanense]